MSVDDLPSLALLALVGKLDIVGDDIDRRGFFGRDEVGQYGPDDRGHAAGKRCGLAKVDTRAGYGSGLSWRAEYARRDDDDRHAVLTTPPEKGLETGVEDDVCRAGPGLQFRSEVNSPSWILTLSQDLLTLGKAVAVGDHALKHLGKRVSAG
jgi:hypothetical protein